MSTVTIQEVTVSTVSTGKKPYQVAEATYTTDRGENKNKKVMSFSNPAVFAALSKIKNPTKVSVENDGAPYYNWTKLTPVTDDDTPTKVKGGTYNDTRETAEERAKRQLMIVKQSSLSNSIAYWAQIKSINNPDYDYTVEEVLEVAQKFVDWVMDFGSFSPEEN